MVFRRDGYVGAGIDAIAEEAGLTKGAVYSHFDSKADLFLSLLEDRIERRVAIQEASVQGRRTPTSVRDFLREVFEQSRTDPEWHLAVLEFRVVAARDPDLLARYAAAHDRTVRGVADTIRELYEQIGVVADPPIEHLARGVLAFDAGTFLEELAAPGAVPGAAITRLMARLVDLDRPA